MADFSLPEGMHFIENGGIVPSTSTTEIVTSGDTDTFGSWSERIASTVSQVDAILVTVDLNDSTHNEIAVNVAVGAAGFEEIVIHSLNVQIKANMPGGYFWCPVRVPVGTRLSVQAATDGNATDVGVALYTYSSSFPSRLGKAGTIAYGMNATEISEGTTIDPGGTINTKGSYAELESSTSDAISDFIICIGTADNVGHSNCSWLIDVAIGGAGSEEIILADLRIRQHSQEPTKPNVRILESIPAGTRIAVRSQCNIIDATDRLLTISLNGVIA
jgi:hypothetical protein